MNRSVAPRAGHDSTAVRARHGFKRPRRGRSDGDDATASVERRVDGLRGRVGDLELFGLHAVLLDHDRPVSAETCHSRRAASPRLARRRARPATPAVRGVKCRPAVGAAIDPRARANTVWYRSRSLALSARLMYGGSGMWPMASTAVRPATRPPSTDERRDDRRTAVRESRHAVLGRRRRSRARPASVSGRGGQAPPTVPRLTRRPLPAASPAGIRRRRHSDRAAPEQPRRKHARVVDDEQVAREQQLRQRRRSIDATPPHFRDRGTAAWRCRALAGGSCAISSVGSSKSKSLTCTTFDRIRACAARHS